LSLRGLQKKKLNFILGIKMEKYLQCHLLVLLLGGKSKGFHTKTKNKKNYTAH